jgi:hypothetical protein
MPARRVQVSPVRWLVLVRGADAVRRTVSGLAARVGR